MKPLIAKTWPMPTDSYRTASRKRFDSSELFSGSQEILIEHAGQEYRLRITRHGKLLLTK